MKFSEIKDGEFFFVNDIPDKRLQKSILTPFGNEVAVTDHFDVILLKSDVECTLYE